MYEIDVATAVASRPASTSLGTPGWFTDGSPGSGVPATILPAEFMNMLMAEQLNLLSAAGIAPSKSISTQVTQAVQTVAGGVIGSMRNLKMSISAASASANLTADEVILETALGGVAYKLANFNKAINLAATGAGGMDTGTAPVSGYVAVYAIFNPTTQASALLATNATSAAQGNLYGGANMPSGYTASALLSVLPTNGSSQFQTIQQMDRQISRTSIQVLNTSTAQSSFTSASMSTAVPLNARTASGVIVSVGGAINAATSFSVASDANGIGQQQAWWTTPVASVGMYVPFSSLLLPTPQTFYYTLTGSAGSGQLFVSSYSF